MGVREKLVERAARFPEDGGAVQQAFRAKVTTPGTRMAKTFVASRAACWGRLRPGSR